MIITLKENSDLISDIKENIDLDGRNNFETERSIGKFKITIKIQRNVGIAVATINKKHTDSDIFSI